MTDQSLSPEHAAIAATIEAEIAEKLAIVRIAETRCKEAFLPILNAHGISRVEINYDGGGDEGSVCDIAAFAGKDPAELPQVLCNHHAPDFHGAIECRAIQLEDALGAFAENAACDHHAGWENGEGAYGCLVIDVASGTVTLTHNDRFIDYDTTETEL